LFATRPRVKVSLIGAVRQEILVDELTAVIRVDAEPREGKHAPRARQRLDNAMLAAVQER
jgi:hypothetical protein